jgi:hypothetical protein
MLATFTLALAALLALDDPPAARADESPDAVFARMLEAAKTDPEKADWKALRLAFSKTKSYTPHLQKLDSTPIMQELKNGERAAALVALDRLLEGRWVDPGAHWLAAFVCAEVEDSKREKLHLAFARGLTNSIINAGDGVSFETAFPVLTLGEEYFVLDDVLKFQKHEKQTLVKHDGHMFDVHTFRSPSGSEVTVHFSIDIPWAAERSLLGLPREGLKP